MRVTAWTLALGAPMVALLACGGRYDVDYVPLDHRASASASDGGGGGSSGSRASSSGSGSGSSSSGSGGSSGSSSGAVETCPPAAAIKGNGACDLDPKVQCPSDITYAGCDGTVAGTLVCSCYDGTWECPEPSTCTFGDGGDCPLPASIQSGMPCDFPGATCPGSPRVCNGQTSYDAFECNDGMWVDVAHSTCDADGG